jgi:heme/copper-type cytochrome/quinol oxidase subunit 3
LSDQVVDSQDNVVKNRSKRMIAYLSVFASVMMFAGFTSAYIVISSDNYWVITNIPASFWISAVLAILSSIALYGAYHFVKKGNRKLTGNLLLLTFILGIFFTYTQFQGWGRMIDKGMFLVGGIMDIKGEYGKDYLIRFPNKVDSEGNKVYGPILDYEDGKFYHPDDLERREPLNSRLEEQANTSSAFVYIFVGMHLLHLFLAMLYVLVNWARTLKKDFNPNRYSVSIFVCGVFWHFLGGLWIYLLLFLTFIY